jgi:MFS family permease
MNNPLTIVDWVENDPENPVNWGKTRKGLRLAGLFLQVILIHFGAFMVVLLIPMLRDRPEADNNLELVSLLVGLYLLGFAAGPLFWRPVGEVHGTWAMETVGSMLCGVVTLGPVYRPDPIPIWGLLLLRFFAGAFGSAVLANGPAVIDDLLPGKAGRWWRLAYPLAQTVGFMIGPLVAIYSGWATDTKNWRYLFYIPGAGVGGVAVVSRAVLSCLDGEGETYAPFVLEEKARLLRNENNGQFRSRYATDLTSWQSFQKKARAPLKLLCTDGKCTAYAVLGSLMYAPQYFMFATMHHVFLKVFSSDDSAPLWKRGPHFWLFGFGVCLGHVLCLIIPRISTRVNNPVKTLRQRLEIGTPAIVVSVLGYGWISYIDTWWAYITMLPVLWIM